MKFEDTIGIYPNVISKELCNKLMSEVDDCGRSGNVGSTVQNKVKNSIDVPIEYKNFDTGGIWKEEWKEYVKTLDYTADIYMKKYHYQWASSDYFQVGKSPLDVFYNDYIYPPTSASFYPMWQIQRYKKGEGHFLGYHIDQYPVSLFPSMGDGVPYGMDPHNKVTHLAFRMFVVMIYLNDVEDGGETEFQIGEFKIKPRRGTMVIWPANYPYYHRGHIPLSSDKYIVTSWLCYSDVEKIREMYKLHNSRLKDRPKPVVYEEDVNK